MRSFCTFLLITCSAFDAAQCDRKDEVNPQLLTEEAFIFQKWIVTMEQHVGSSETQGKVEVGRGYCLQRRTSALLVWPLAVCYWI